MKKTSITKSPLYLSLVILISFISCKKEELVSKELLIFLKGEYGSTNNTITGSLTRTPNAVWGNKIFDVPVYATREVPAEISAFIGADDAAVDQYNQDNGTSFLLLPQSTYKITGGPSLKIAAGTSISSPAQIEITDAAALTDTRGYILPIRVTKLEGEDKGARISANQGTVFITIPYKYTNVDSVETPLSTTLMSRTGWSVTVSNSSSGSANQANNMLDGNNGTWWRSSNSATAAKTITLNMGSVQQVSGFRLSPNYNNVNENATQITVSTSTDNVTYTPQGIWKGTGPAAGSSSSAPDFKGINFITPVQARYYKFEINSWVSTNIVGVAEINAIQ